MGCNVPFQRTYSRKPKFTFPSRAVIMEHKIIIPRNGWHIFRKRPVWRMRPTVYLVTLCKVPSTHWHTEMLNKCGVMICMPTDDLGQSGALILNARHSSLFRFPQKSLRGRWREEGGACFAQLGGQRGLQQWAHGREGSLISFNCQMNLRCCHKTTRHREIFQTYHTLGWSSTR